MTVETIFHADPSGKSFTIERRQDVEPIIESNNVLRSQEQRSDFLRHVARVPAVELEKWLNEEWARGNTTLQWGTEEFWAMCWRKIKDPDYIKLRVDNAYNGVLGFGS